MKQLQLIQMSIQDLQKILPDCVRVVDVIEKSVDRESYSTQPSFLIKIESPYSPRILEGQKLMIERLEEFKDRVRDLRAQNPNA